jgi:hypothetical protein
LGEIRIEFRARRSERRAYGIPVAHAKRRQRAGIAGGFQLPRTPDAFEEQLELIVIQR